MAGLTHTYKMGITSTRAMKRFFGFGPISSPIAKVPRREQTIEEVLSRCYDPLPSYDEVKFN